MKNVMLLTIDALRRDALGCYGSPDRLTPFIDSLATRATVFTRAQSSGPFTQASFPGLLASSYYLEYGNPALLAPERKLVSEPLRAAGFATAAFHSNPYLCGEMGWDRGWQMFYDSMEEDVDDLCPYVPGKDLNRKLEAYLKSGAFRRDRGLFLWLHYMDVHEPYIAQQAYIEMLDPALALDADGMLQLFQDVLLKRDVSDPGKVELLRRLYRLRVREVDDLVRDLFAMLERFDLLRDGAVVITSDHGDEFGEHGGLSHDDKMYRELIDIPLLVVDPANSAGQVRQDLVSNVDVPPTILHLLGVAQPAGWAGHSLFPVDAYPTGGCFGEALSPQSRRKGEMENEVYFYREGDLKLIYRPLGERWEVYDLASDPSEKQNIHGRSPESTRLQEKLAPMVRRWTKGKR